MEQTGTDRTPRQDPAPVIEWLTRFYDRVTTCCGNPIPWRRNEPIGRAWRERPADRSS